MKSSKSLMPKYGASSSSSLLSPTLSLGEQHFEFLKKLGYEPTSRKTKKPEYFEYLFQDDKTAKFVKALMKKATREHVMSPAEVAK
jgi:hypothetical protein